MTRLRVLSTSSYAEHVLADRRFLLHFLTAYIGMPTCHFRAEIGLADWSLIPTTLWLLIFGLKLVIFLSNLLLLIGVRFYGALISWFKVLGLQTRLEPFMADWGSLAPGSNVKSVVMCWDFDHWPRSRIHLPTVWFRFLHKLFMLFLSFSDFLPIAYWSLILEILHIIPSFSEIYMSHFFQEIRILIFFIRQFTF